MPVEVQEDKVILKHALGSSAEVYFYGATLTSWKYHEKELLFLSKKSFLNGTKAIRGGIPLVFPQFGKASDSSVATAALPQHGFARISKFEWIGVSVDNESEVSVRFGLNDTQIPENVRKDWPKKFKLIFIVTLNDDTLRTNLIVKNEDKAPFDFQALLHTYYSVPDISKVSIEGFYNVSYVDKVNNFITNVDNDQSIKIDQETDRIYANVPTETIKINLGDESNEVFLLKRINLKDTVVWNPWIDKAKGMSDYDDDEYKQMVCVEPGNVSNYITLNPEESWEGGQIIQYKH
ncbi:galactose mutarotase-like domain-containing protein [Glomus cerebriforme]|uniref:Glucose-6-phosphate 1-epimerase n=1 Tax=Glomus cerebriforme TaxID=658196 RepID=A0A397SGX1_9GLOM|nr:galactose mutarotase-like domain-containing protein [Glomus cerebriforme]